MTRIAKGRQNGELWDRVKLPNGMVGYVFQTYIEEVKDIPVTKVTISLDNTTLQKGERISLKVQVLPENATDKKLTYTSSNSKIVSVDSTGRLLALSSGEATITAKSVNNISSSIKVTVYSKVTGLEIKEQDLVMQVGEKYKVEPLVLPDDATNPSVSFSSSNKEVATIDNNGNIIAVKEGNCKIEVKTQEGNYEKEFALVVIPKLEEGAIEFGDGLKVIGNQIIGIEEKTTVEKLLTKITSKYEIQIENANGTILQKDDLIGTECKIKLLETDKVVIQYHIILYGDVNRRWKN